MLVISLVVNVVLSITVLFLVLQLKESWTNSNFECLSKQAGEKLGPWVARRPKSGREVMIGIDVAGMGAANSAHGEKWVNKRVRAALAEVRKIRDVQLLTQKNSGDEFLILCPEEDVLGVSAKVESIFLSQEFGTYIGWVHYDYTLDWVGNGDAAMEVVYKIKQARKG